MDTKVSARARRTGGATVLALLAAGATAAVAADRTGLEAGSPRVEPNVRWGVMPDVALKIQMGFALAVARAGSVTQCAALFRELDADPVKLLGRTFYYPAARNTGNRVCNRDMSAFTQVGSPVTWVCDGFARLSTEKAALVILHEALHTAGLPEQPQDPRAMTSGEINSLVMNRCSP